jgi:hypothetical protein
MSLFSPFMVRKNSKMRKVLSFFVAKNAKMHFSIVWLPSCQGIKPSRDEIHQAKLSQFSLLEQFSLVMCLPNLGEFHPCKTAKIETIFKNLIFTVTKQS